jgi:hypothetical protein
MQEHCSVLVRFGQDFSGPRYRNLENLDNLENLYGHP